MSMKLNTEQQQMVLDNQRLVHYLVQKLGVTPNSTEYEDIVSIGTIGLIKAAITFDISKKNTFATYASRCINNEIFKHYRKANKYANDISLEDPIGDDGKGNEMTLGDKIEHPKSNFVEKIVNTETFIQLVSIILNYLESRKRLVMLYRMGNISQVDIAKMFNISRSYVSRIEQKATLKIREAINQQVHYKEVFSMDVMGDSYKITFSSKDISNFNKIFATLLQNLTSTATLPDFKVNCNKERIIIQIPAHPESFSFIAQIIQEIDNFSMTFVSDKSILPKDNTVSHTIESDVIVESNNAVERTETNTTVQKVLDEDTIEKVEETVIKNSIIENSIPTSAEVHTVLATDTDSTVEKGSQVKQVRDYMLSMDSFTVRELKKHFSNLTAGTINNALYLAKNKGLIIAIGRGEYRVNNAQSHTEAVNSPVADNEVTVIERNQTTQSNIDKKTTKHISQSKRIRDYILTLENFSVKQVISHFPDIPTALVNNVIRITKTKGLITATARGEYVVNKI